MAASDFRPVVVTHSLALPLNAIKKVYRDEDGDAIIHYIDSDNEIAITHSGLSFDQVMKNWTNVAQ